MARRTLINLLFLVLDSKQLLVQRLDCRVPLVGTKLRGLSICEFDIIEASIFGYSRWGGGSYERDELQRSRIWAPVLLYFSVSALTLGSSLCSLWIIAQYASTMMLLLSH